LFEGKILKIVKVLWDEPNKFYELEWCAGMLFSKEMLEEPSMEEIEDLHKVTIIHQVEAPPIESVSEWPEVESESVSKPVKQTISQDNVAIYVDVLRGFVEKYRDAFKTEELFWEFFYEKAATELYLTMNGVVFNKPENKDTLIINDTKHVKGRKRSRN